ncbi:MAG: hypothetical protein ABII64_09955 [Elusimicrobiota bacterium]
MKKYFASFLLIALMSCIVALPAYTETDDGKTSYMKKEVELRLKMRELFTNYLVWQRIYASSILSGAGATDMNNAGTRLANSQNGIANAFRPFYGEETGNQLAFLLNQYTQLLTEYADIVKRDGDKSDITQRIRENSDITGELLNRINMNWPGNEISGKLIKYYDLLGVEISYQGKHYGSIDVNALDATFYQGMLIADTLTFGIVKHHPGKFW